MRMNIQIKTLFFVLFLSVPMLSYSQVDAGIGFSSFSVHPFAENDLALVNKSIDNKGYFTFEPGLNADFNVPVHNNIRAGGGIKVISDRFSGVTIGLDAHVIFKLMKYWNHRLFIGVGPAVYIYQNRDLPENYTGDERYTLSEGGLPYRLVPVTGFIEYSYNINKQTWLTLSLNQPHPVSIGFAAGVRFIIPDSGGKGCDCPSYR
ncbi:MAG: hypothetical protein U9N85_06955 [Bacteroidota bacterium]|nr:hypothetical protein [Bacteroidota bacterium]